jgi:uncharacterized protein (DUF1810 family)
LFPLRGTGDVDVPEPDLSRFLAAQDDVYPQVLGELQACRKTSHWIWFIFPQIAGLGQSDMARRYAIADLAEASAYLTHPVLGPRLRAVTSLMLACGGASARAVLGAPDDVKFRSCLTLFQAVAASAEDKALFAAGLDQFFDGLPDPATLSILRAQEGRTAD